MHPKTDWLWPLRKQASELRSATLEILADAMVLTVEQLTDWTY